MELYSPFQNIPEYSKFGVDMTEHIAFDNLPNATGKWDEMRKGIIKKVREKMKIKVTSPLGATVTKKKSSTRNRGC